MKENTGSSSQEAVQRASTLCKARTLALGQLEADAIEEGHDLLLGAEEDDVTLCQQHDVVKQVVHLRRWLQQRH